MSLIRERRPRARNRRGLPVPPVVLPDPIPDPIPPPIKRVPGHPPLDDEHPSVPVHVKMPSHQYDDTYARAQANRITVPEQIRRDMHAAEEKRNPK